MAFSKTAQKLLSLWTSDTSRDVLMGTGHRPERLRLDYSSSSNELLTQFLRASLEERPRPHAVLTGGALGFDLCLAHAAILLGIPSWVAVPFDGYERKWPAKSQERFQRVLEKSEQVIVVCDGGYAAHKNMERNSYMVKLATRSISLWDGVDKGGTAHAINELKKFGIPNDNLWEHWITHSFPAGK